ncbi:unnamed protein product [Linum trigynum]|uniref:Uncharacterized protein n=1 Tax=Linum trigynum TaxID=586398 RepID=A0AAV2GVX6_9ROSI
MEVLQPTRSLAKPTTDLKAIHVRYNHLMEGVHVMEQGSGDQDDLLSEEDDLHFELKSRLPPTILLGDHHTSSGRVRQMVKAFEVGMTIFGVEKGHGSGFGQDHEFFGAVEELRGDEQKMTLKLNEYGSN